MEVEVGFPTTDSGQMISSVSTAWRSAAPLARSSPGASLYDEVRRGLGLRPRLLPPRYFFDDRGALLFERIMQLEEYYAARTELGIVRQHVPEMAALIGAGVRVIGLGSGSGALTRILLEHLREPYAYLPVDIARNQLLTVADAAARQFPALRVQPVWADYTGDVSLPDPDGGTHTLAFFPGSTIGNFEPPEAEAFLRRLWWLCGAGGQLLIGADLHKDAAVVERAYNDAPGVTAAFNLNLLERINRECGTNFDPGKFRHLAFYDRELQRVEMRLVCTRACSVVLPARGLARSIRIEFPLGDYIVTEYAHKYTRDAFSRLAERAGWSVQRTWTDERHWFGVWLLARR